MQKQMTLFKSVIGEFENYFYFESGTSTEIAKAALLDCLKWVGQIEDQAKAQQEALKNESVVEPVEPQKE